VKTVGDAFAGFLSFVLLSHALFSQELLPGAPAPSMQTLDQVESRTDLVTLAGDDNDLIVIPAADQTSPCPTKTSSCTNAV
jgi:hypothetical protein